MGFSLESLQLAGNCGNYLDSARLAFLAMHAAERKDMADLAPGSPA